MKGKSTLSVLTTVGLQRALKAVLLCPLLAGASYAATTAPVTIITAQGTQKVTAEIAETPEQRELGLMNRSALADAHGMLFSYRGHEQPADNGYWMYRTLIPLDIAFIDRHGVITRTFTMPPCRASKAQECPIFRPDVPYVAALEMAGGYFAEHRIGAGDRVVLPAK
ncbi:DUF192 domain-containing protein [Carnimonas bestiolae]|uniref:DUF192 domain-containing protein n=1 Tax=Carnimonas bestiolae TaxID=3402172 RepID=UPI003EDBD38B